MKRYRLLLLTVCCLLLAGCHTNTQSSAPDASIEEELSPSHTPDAGISPDDNQTEDVEYKPGNTSLEEAVLSAIFQENAGKYFPGECQGAGYKIFEVFADDETAAVYALIEYIEYGFQDDLFVNVSGTCARVLLTFKIEDGPSYDLIGYTLLDSMSGLTDEELEELMAPLVETGKDYTYTDAVFEELRDQADSCAREYLQSIGRNAAVCERDPHRDTSLLALGVNEDVYFMLVKDESTNSYPEWNGTCEKIEAGVRYVYRTCYDDSAKTVRYTKTQYETGEIVEEMTFDAVTGNAI